tara:strand:+ start:3884 stop:4078 length:195 start_codon:yes stop_codon:yes gene_type:complete
MMLCNESLQSYYTNNFSLMKHHGWSLSDLENMVPWERDIYILLTENWVKEEKEKMEQAKQQRGA